MAVTESRVESFYLRDTITVNNTSLFYHQTNTFRWPGDPTICYVRYSNTSFLGSANLYPSAAQI